MQTEKELQTTISSLDENGRKLSTTVENTVGKGEIVCYEQFLLFKVFSEGLYCRQVKTRPCLGKGYQNKNVPLYCEGPRSEFESFLQLDLHLCYSCKQLVVASGAPRFKDTSGFNYVTEDHSFKHGYFPIQIQYLTTVLERILFSSLSGYGIGFWCTRSLLQILHGPYISAMHLFMCFFFMDFVLKNYL